MPKDTLTKNHVLVIDYGVGNLLSVTNALERLGYFYTVSSSLEDIQNAPAYILPGVGAFKEAMHNIEALGIAPMLRTQVLEAKKPLLGICLGMQILAEDSDENGLHTGLGFIPGHVVRIPQEGVRIPHVGWNSVEIHKKSPLFERCKENPQFYFDHSYHFATDATFVAASCTYGTAVTAAVAKDNIFGAQFHPEKSEKDGLRVLRAFCAYAGLTPKKTNYAF